MDMSGHPIVISHWAVSTGQLKKLGAIFSGSSTFERLSTLSMEAANGCHVRCTWTSAITLQLDVLGCRHTFRVWTSFAPGKGSKGQEEWGQLRSEYRGPQYRQSILQSSLELSNRTSAR